MDQSREAALEELFEQALDLPQDERRALLDSACSNDPSVRGELEKLLAVADEAASFFERLSEACFSPEGWSSGGSKVAGTDPLDEALGERLQQYELLDRLGGGGMGVVYRARDTRLDRLVALKFLPSHLSGDEAAKTRFKLEARAVAALDHPNVCAIHEIAEDEGRAFLAMAYYEGETLHDKITRGPLPIDEAAEYARQIAAGLSAAHAQGIIHRDVKPGNVIVTPDSVVKLLDFGLAKAADTPPTEEQKLLGTVGYLSPEQVRREPYDHRTDIWSLGVVCYEMLTGERPFAGEHAGMILHGILHEEPEPTFARRPAIPPAVDAAVMRALTKSPDGRPSTVDEFSQLLGGEPGATAASAEAAGGVKVAAVEEEGVSTGVVRPEHDPDGLGQSKGHRRARLAATVSVAALLISAAILFWTRSGGGRTDNELSTTRVAVLPFSVQGGEQVAYLEQGMVELLSRTLDRAGELSTVDPIMVLRVAGASGDEESESGSAVAARLGAGLYVTGTVAEANGRLRLQARLHDATREGAVLARSEVEGSSDDLFHLVDSAAQELAVSRYESSSGRLARLASRTTESLPALKAYLRGEAAIRAGFAHAALGEFRQAVEHDSTFALAHYRIAVAAARTWELDAARRAASDAVHYSGRLSEEDRMLISAFQAYLSGEAAEAERLYVDLVGRQVLNLEVWLMLGEVQARYNPYRGRSWREALDTYQQALALDPDNRQALQAFFNEALEDRRLEVADSLLRRAVASAGYASWRSKPLARHLWGERRELDEAIDEVGGRPHFLIERSVNNLTLHLTRLEPARRVARLLQADDAPPEWRAVGHLRLAELEIASGRPTAAASEIASASDLGYGRVLEVRARIATLPFAPLSRAGLDELRDDLEAWDADTRPPVPSGMTEPLDDSIRPRLRLYYLGLTDAQLGDRSAAIRYARELQAAATGSGDAAALAVDLSRGIRAQVALEEGRPDDALKELERAGFAAPWHMALSSPHYGRVRERYLRAELLHRLGRLEEALYWFEGLARDPAAVAYRAPSHLRQAEIYESRGRVEKAARHYRLVIELLEGCEPTFQPMVEDAREGLRGIETT